jgi:hypothetical protein
MFGWMKSLVVWTPEDARRRIWAGDAPPGMRVNGDLDLANSPQLKCLPPGLSAGRIDISGCTSLTKLPAGLQCRELRLRRTAIEWLPPDLNVSTRIDAHDCRRLRLIPPLRLDEMDLRRCTALEQLPDGLIVRSLNVSGCTHLTSVPAGAAALLEHLDASGCTALTTLPVQLTHLLDLNISGCGSLTSLPDGMRVRSWIELAGASLTGVPWSLRSVRLLWRGVPVSDGVAFDPESITASEVLYEENQALRGLLLERMGLERFVQEARAEVLDRDQDRGGDRQLLRVHFNSGEDLVCVVVHCPSTGHRYLLRVPPLTRTCREAIAWTAGFENPAEYQPMVET